MCGVHDLQGSTPALAWGKGQWWWEGDTLGTLAGRELLGDCWDHSEPLFPHL